MREQPAILFPGAVAVQLSHRCWHQINNAHCSGSMVFLLNSYLQSRLVLAFASRDHNAGLGGIFLSFGCQWLSQHLVVLLSRELGIQPIEFRGLVAMMVSIP